jgi:hypothetical protein
LGRDIFNLPSIREERAVDDKELYDLLAMLDRLEEVREDLEELGLVGDVGEGDAIDDDLREELAVLGLRSIDDVERRIAELNAQIDLREDPVE